MKIFQIFRSKKSNKYKKLDEYENEGERGSGAIRLTTVGENNRIESARRKLKENEHDINELSIVAGTIGVPRHLTELYIMRSTQLLTSSRNYHRRGAVYEDEMKKDLHNLKYAFIIENIKYSGIL